MSQNRNDVRPILNLARHQVAASLLAIICALSSGPGFAAGETPDPAPPPKRAPPGVVIEPMRPLGEDNGSAREDQDRDEEGRQPGRQAPGCPLRQKNLDVFV